MARLEHDKEDLIADATAMIDRAEYQLESLPFEYVTLGFRKDDSFSVYLDQDPFYQFDAAGRLRRSFKADRLFRSQGNTLAAMTRDRSSDAVVLQRVDLSPDELEAFRSELQQQMTALLAALQTDPQPTRSVFARENFLQRAIAAIQTALNHDAGEWLSSQINAR